MTFRTAKGAYFDLDGSSASSSWNLFGIKTTQNTLQFYFDVNGDKKPNVIGKDIYILVYEPDRDYCLQVLIKLKKKSKIIVLMVMGIGV